MQTLLSQSLIIIFNLSNMSNTEDKAFSAKRSSINSESEGTGKSRYVKSATLARRGLRAFDSGKEEQAEQVKEPWVAGGKDEAELNFENNL